MEASRRALAGDEALIRAGKVPNIAPSKMAEKGAREALAPIRRLHKPSDDNCQCCRHCVECGQIGMGWPCDTAKLIYTTSELENR